MSLIDLVPSYHKSSKYTADILQAMDRQTEKLLNAKDDLLAQLNVRTATWGLELWEKALGIQIDATKPYPFRRSRIESKLRAQGITTKIMIKNVAESFSNGVVDIIEHPELYLFDVKFIGTLGIPPNMDDLSAAIEEIKPAHLAYRYIYTYFTWDMAETYGYSWDEWESKNLTWNEFEIYREG